jgi:type IV secretion system protein VirB4
MRLTEIKKPAKWRLTSKVKTLHQIDDREVGLSDYYPLSHLMDEHTFVTKNGDLGVVLSLKGIAFEVSSEEELTLFNHRLADFYKSLPTSMAVYCTLHRGKENAYPHGDFPASFAKDFNVAYAKTFEHQSLYVNRWYLTLILKNPTKQGSKKWVFLKELFHIKHFKDQKEVFKKMALTLQQYSMEALSALSDYLPRLLGDVDFQGGKRSEVLGFLSLCMNGKYAPVVKPHPFTSLSRYLPQERLSFGHQVMEWRGNTALDKRFGAMLSIKEYQHQSKGMGLKFLLSANFSFISTHIFLPQSKTFAIDLMNVQLSHLSDSGDAALSQKDALEAARDGVASSFIGFGQHQHTLLILSDSQQSLDEKIAHLSQIYQQEIGLVLIRESTNLKSAYFSQIPANFTHMRRAALVSNENFSDYAPFYNYHHGYKNGNHLGSAWALMESQGRTPLYFNFHEKGFGTKDNPPLGHALMLAPAGSGKTTLLCALDALGKKYHGHSFFFDRDRGCEIYVRAMGGFYARIKAGMPTGFNPLQLPDTPENRAFLIHWFGSLLVGNALLPEASRKEVEALIHRNFTLPKSSRRLSVIVDFLPVDFAYMNNLSPWLRSKNDEPDGSLAYLFDHTEDTLDLTRYATAGFDMTALLTPENEQVAPAVFLYLFHRLETLMDGRLFSLYLDEAWQFLNHPYWVSKMEVFLLSKRKANVHMTFISQSADKILKSPLKSHLLENTATHIFLANDKACPKTYMDGLQLSQGQYHFIHTTGKASRKFLFRQGHEVAVGRLNLSGLEDYIRIFSANESSVRLCDTVRAEVGDDPRCWIPLFLKKLNEGTV